MHGLWLEGADWEDRDRCLVETTKQTRFIQFPVIKLSTVLSSELSPTMRRHTAAHMFETSSSYNKFKNTSPPSKRESKRAPNQSPDGREALREGGSGLRSSPRKKMSIKKLTSKRSLAEASSRLGSKRELVAEGGSPPRQSGATEREATQPFQYCYRCPVFKSTLRLSAPPDTPAEVQAVTHIKLNSSHEPSKWIKRGTALVLEPEYT